MFETFDSPAEAFAAIGLFVIAVDDRLTSDEATHIFESMQSMEIFRDCDPFVARRTIGQIVNLSYTLPSRLDARVAFEELLMNNLTTAASEVLELPLREAALTWAVELAFADSLDEREQALLYRLAEGLEVERRFVDDAIARLDSSRA